MRNINRIRCRISKLNLTFSINVKLSVSVVDMAITVGGGGPTTKKTKDILRFSRRHDLFCSFLFSI